MNSIYVDFTFTWNQNYLSLENPMKESNNIFRNIIRKAIVEAYRSGRFTVKPIEPKNKEYVGLADGSEVTILKNKSGELYAFFRANYGDNDFRPYGEHDEADWESDSDIYVDEEVVARYVNDNLKSLSVGQGMEGWSNGEDLVKIDHELAEEIFSTWPEDDELTTAMSDAVTTAFQDMNGMKLKAFTLKGDSQPFAWYIMGENERHVLARLEGNGNLYIVGQGGKYIKDTGFENNPVNAVRYVFLHTQSKKP